MQNFLLIMILLAIPGGAGAHAADQGHVRGGGHAKAWATLAPHCTPSSEGCDAYGRTLRYSDTCGFDQDVDDNVKLPKRGCHKDWEQKWLGK